MGELYDTYIKTSCIPKRYLNSITLIPASVDEKTFEELNDIRNNIVDFVKNGKNLLICSNNVGNGKTTWSVKMLKEFIRQTDSYRFKNNCPVLFLNVSSFLTEKKLAISDRSLQEHIRDIESKILSANLVLFDDLCITDVTQYDLNSLYYWVDYRTSNMKSCIFTSNLLPNQLKNVLDERLYSRIVKYSIIKEIKDGDSRGC